MFNKVLYGQSAGNENLKSFSNPNAICNLIEAFDAKSVSEQTYKDLYHFLEAKNYSREGFIMCSAATSGMYDWLQVIKLIVLADLLQIR